MRRAEGGAKCLGYFVWKITILRQKILFFPILGGAHAGWAPPPLYPPLQTFIDSFYEYTIYILLWIMMLYDCYYYYYHFLPKYHVAKRENNINEWFIILRDIILLMKSQLVTTCSYSLKFDVNRCFEIRLCQIVNMYRNRLCHL